MIRWDHDRCLVGFTTREGGVSEGPYSSLNLGRMTGDDPERVDENRRRAFAELGLDAEDLVVNRQIHSPIVHRAHRGARGEPGDGLWTDESCVPMLVLSADCVPIAIAGDGRLAVLHAGWRGLLEGVVEAGVTAIGGGDAAVVGPAIGPCCYEVGPDVSERFDADLTRDRRLEVPALVQVNLAGDGSKSGVAPDELDSYLDFDVRGLSTMPPEAADPEASRPWFRRLRELAHERDLGELSMGTTQDYRAGAEEGATYVRIGRVLFGGE